MSALACKVDFPEPRTAGDNARHFVARAYDEDTGLDVDLGGFVATFKLVTFDGATVIVNDLPCIVSAGSGLVTYIPAPADVATAGHYLGRFKLVGSDASVLLLGPVAYEICSDI